jgi:hypothetical protein
LEDEIQVLRYISDDMSEVEGKSLPKVPPFILDIFLTSPSMVGPAISVPRREATKAERLVRPTALTEKLYGGAEKICERVIEIPTSHEMQVVKRRVAQSTAGEPSNTNGRKIVLKNET